MNILANMQYKNVRKRSFLPNSCHNSEKWFNFASTNQSECDFYTYSYGTETAYLQYIESPQGTV